MARFNKDYILSNSRDKTHKISVSFDFQELEDEQYAIEFIIDEAMDDYSESQTYQINVTKHEADTYAFDLENYASFNDYLADFFDDENLMFIELFELFNNLFKMSVKKEIRFIDIDL